MHAWEDDHMTTSQYDELLLDAYRGEVFGEAFFGAMLDGALGVEHADAIAALRDVEAQTASRLHARVDAHNLQYAGDPVGEGTQLGTASSAGSWTDFLSSLRQFLPDFLARFEQLRALDPADPVFDDLIAHEQAIDRFAELALAGDEPAGLAVLRAHLATPAPAGR
jgi:hypothetical protein